MSANGVPANEQEIIRRATARALLALQRQQAQLGIGFAEGIFVDSDAIYGVVWCVLLTPSGKTYMCGSPRTRLPNSLEEKFRPNRLMEIDVERYLEQEIENPYEPLVENVVEQFQNHRDLR